MSQQPIQSSQVTPTMPESNKTSSKKPLLLVVATVIEEVGGYVTRIKIETN